MTLKALLRSIRWEAQDILTFRLEAAGGNALPAFTAGAHVNVTVRPGLARSYSLFNDPEERGVYEIAVQLDAGSRGGSRAIHAQWRAGQVVEVSEPNNHFPLDESASHTILIAGGIGITPMLAMMARLDRLGRPWELHYAVKSMDRCAFADRLADRDNVYLAVSDEGALPRLDIPRIVGSAKEGAHVYCCGPERMLNAVRDHGAVLGSRLHYEYFSADTEVATDGGYSLVLKKSGRSVEVQAGETMLDALLNAGLNVGFACSEGICGSCRIGVLEGEPDHRDNFLSDEEKRANRAVMVCCSGSRSPSLTLDL